MFDLVTIGDATFDTFLVLDDESSSVGMHRDKKLLCINYADKTPIKNSAQSTGGNAANIAVGLKKLGLSTSIITELGEDITGHIIEHELKDSGVDTGNIKILKSKATRYSIILNYKSERTVLSYHAPRSYSLMKIPATKWIYYTSLGKSFSSLQKQLCSHLKKHPSIKIAMNPGSFQFKHGLKKVCEMLDKTDILFVNREEAATILNSKRNIKSSLKAIHKKGVKTVVITDGTEGSYTYDGENFLFMKAYPIKAVAKTGAGDAYASGFMGAIINNKTIAEAMQWGTANAVSVIQEFGAQKGLANKRKISTIVKEHSKISPKSL